MKKRYLVISLTLVLFASLVQAVSPVDYSVETSGYDIIATNNLEYPISLNIIYHKLAENLSIDTDVSIEIDVNANAAFTYSDSLTTVQGCGLEFPCQIWLVNYTLTEVHMNEGQFNSLFQRLTNLESTVQQHEERISLLESWQITLTSWQNDTESYIEELLTTVSQHGERLGFLEDQESRITSLEASLEELGTWTGEMDNWRGETSDEISNLGSDITNLYGTSEDQESRVYYLEQAKDDFEARIALLENLNVTDRDYWRFLDANDRKNIICGLAVEDHLEHLEITDLGYQCDVRYTRTQYGERHTCRCFRIQE